MPYQVPLLLRNESGPQTDVPILSHIKIGFTFQCHNSALSDKTDRIKQFRTGIQMNSGSISKKDSILSSPWYNQSFDFTGLSSTFSSSCCCVVTVGRYDSTPLLYFTWTPSTITFISFFCTSIVLPSGKVSTACLLPGLICAIRAWDSSTA